jgi:hypothetical protein
MPLRFLTPSGTLNEQAWAEMCASAAQDAANGCNGSDVLFRSRFSRTIVAELALLPADVRARAIALANEHGDFATAEELDGGQAERAGAGMQSGIEFIEAPDEIEALEISFQESERLHMLEGMQFRMQAAIIDAAHGGSMAKAMLIGTLKSWAREGLRAKMYRLPQPMRNGRAVWLVLIRARQRQFCTDFQLELSVGPDGAGYSSNVHLENADGSEVLPHTLPDNFGSWMVAVLRGFREAAVRLDAMLLPPPLAESPDWAQIDLAFLDRPNTPRG